MTPAIIWHDDPYVGDAIQRAEFERYRLTVLEGGRNKAVWEWCLEHKGEHNAYYHVLGEGCELSVEQAKQTAERFLRKQFEGASA